MKTRAHAFTLIELLVVIGIITVIAALLLPALSAARKRALNRSMSAVGGESVVRTEPTPGVNASATQNRPLANIKMQTPPGNILDTFHIDLTAVGSDVRMLELSLQPTKYSRGNGQTVYTWDYKRLLFGRPIALDVLGVAPNDRLGELTWLGPASVVVFGFLLGLVANAFYIRKKLARIPAFSPGSCHAEMSSGRREQRRGKGDDFSMALDFEFLWVDLGGFWRIKGERNWETPN